MITDTNLSSIIRKVSKSPFGTEGNPARCYFCNSRHVLKDEKIVQLRKNNRWGSLDCYINKKKNFDEVLSIATAREKEVFDEEIYGKEGSQTARQDAINRKILILPDLSKNSKVQLVKYIGLLNRLKMRI